MGGQPYYFVRVRRLSQGLSGIASLPFSLKRIGLCSTWFTFIKFFQEVRFCKAKAYFIVIVSAKPETFRRFEANRFNLPLRIAGRADTLYSVLTALCSHRKNFSVEKFWSRFFKSGQVQGGALPAGGILVGFGAKPQEIPRRRHPRGVRGEAPRKA